jgi:hypothetical protein
MKLKKVFSLVALSLAINSFVASNVQAGVYNKLENVNANQSAEDYFADKLQKKSKEEESLQEALSQEDVVDRSELLNQARDIRDDELDGLNQRYATREETTYVYEEPKDECGFFCSVWRVVTYPFRAIGRIF